jgi:hypothetical protein
MLWLCVQQDFIKESFLMLWLCVQQDFHENGGF